MKKRTVALLCAAVALLGVIFGGTMAWLNRGTAPVVNTFTTANVGLTLEETTGPYIMAPGAVLDKDPKVMVYADSASCYVFVKVEANFKNGDPITWTPAKGWTQIEELAPKEIVYYRVFNESEPDGTKETVKVDGADCEVYSYPFLDKNQVSVSAQLTKAEMDKAYRDDIGNLKKDTFPTLQFTAYAIQQDYLKNADGEPITNAVGAWALVNQKAVSDATET